MLLEVAKERDRGEEKQEGNEKSERGGGGGVT